MTWGAWRRRLGSSQQEGSNPSPRNHSWHEERWNGQEWWDGQDVAEHLLQRYTGSPRPLLERSIEDAILDCTNLIQSVKCDLPRDGGTQIHLWVTDVRGRFPIEALWKRCQMQVVWELGYVGFVLEVLGGTVDDRSRIA